MAGQPVTVWGQTRSPRKEFVAYYTDVLNQIGFKATSKIIADAPYFATIGNAKTEPQTGFADWIQDFPNPIDFYLLMDANSIQADQQPELQPGRRPAHPERAAKLNAVPATKLDIGRRRWQTLDEYVAKKAYVAGLRAGGAAEVPSNRIDFGAAVFHPLYLNDWTHLAAQVGEPATSRRWHASSVPGGAAASLAADARPAAGARPIPRWRAGGCGATAPRSRSARCSLRDRALCLRGAALRAARRAHRARTPTT